MSFLFDSVIVSTLVVKFVRNGENVCTTCTCVEDELRVVSASMY